MCSKVSSVPPFDLKVGRLLSARKHSSEHELMITADAVADPGGGLMLLLNHDKLPDEATVCLRPAD